MQGRKWCALPLNRLYDDDVVKVREPILKGRIWQASVAAQPVEVGLYGTRFTFGNFLLVAKAFPPLMSAGLHFPLGISTPAVCLPQQFIFSLKRGLKTNKQTNENSNDIPHSHCSIQSCKISHLPSAGKAAHLRPGLYSWSFCAPVKHVSETVPDDPACTAWHTVGPTNTACFPFSRVSMPQRQVF